MKKISFLLAALIHIAASAYTITGKVVEVLDGDTIKVQTNQQIAKIRLAYIDAPELDQKFGTISRNSLSMLTRNKQVVADCKEKDMYGRDLCVVVVEDIVTNDAQLARGLAWAYTQYLPKNSHYPIIEAKAKKEGRGLWSDAKPVAPWDFRRTNKK
ncbi:COG1525 Micrococcal nuclease (thermonuclease) homologs [uncultured Caudovirales phage]|uniref:COG1525 Micrococcal nuclease (Thermonuclease) homologs n=1 Tax=uncultured Caudovirales phage TaxID=2100421 RepID=A0A6J5L8K6_9CAUD|nr:COG1525 Micrococcal nuclease (thermonuclease) homologs [uncultured Caudovirales phage]